MVHYFLHGKHQIVRQIHCNLYQHTIQILLMCIILQQSWCYNAELTLSPNSQQTKPDNEHNFNLGPLQRSGDSTNSDIAIFSQADLGVRGSIHMNVGAVRSLKAHHHGQNYKQQQPKRLVNNNSNEQAKKEDDAFLTNCFAKRNEILERQRQTAAVYPGRIGSSSTTASPIAGFQRIRPKVENSGGGSTPSPIVLNITMANNYDGEHVPRCKQDGSYDPVQCHRIGYCWCVNKYGQAIKNSAVRSGELPECDPNLYESENSNQLLVAGISAHRIRGVLKAGASAFDSSTPNGNINFEATEPTTTQEISSIESMHDGGHQQVEPHYRLSGGAGGGPGHGPVMSLIPNDCKSSRENAKTRAANQVNDSIWIPECDNSEERLYAEQQCHKSRVCWCVDQITGLPLRTSEQLSSRPSSHNCTEIKRILGIASSVRASSSSTGSMKSGQAEAATSTTTTSNAFYMGSSEYCDADKRADFVVSLNNQFRHQISEHLRQNPTSVLPSDLSSTNPYQISDSQVAKWKFNIMDRDSDGKIGDREWSKFKNNFKLVDKVAELDNPLKQQRSPYFSLTPLLIVRSQRKCWRDFLEFCGNGELIDESISLPVWLSCTEVPPRSSRDEQGSRNSASIGTENTYALSREAAIVRSQKKNPFLGILKPD